MMETSLRRMLIQFASIFLIGLLLACAPAEAPPNPSAKAPAVVETAKPAVAPTSRATPRPLANVKFGHTSLVSDAGVFIALDKGYFTEQGIDLELVTFGKTADIIPALSSGQIEVSGSSTTPSLFNAITRGIPLKIVADKSACPLGWGFRALMIRTDLVNSGQYKGIADLKGKTIGHLAKFTSDQYMLELLLNKQGLSLKDVNEVFLDAPSTVTALANKSIDAALQGEPTIAQIQQQGLAKRVAGCDEVIPEVQTAQLIYAPQFYKDTDLAGRFMVAYVKGLRVYNDAFGKKKNLDDVVRILTNYTLIKDAPMYSKMVPAGLNPDGHVNPRGYSPMLDWFVKNGALDKMPDMSSIVDNQYADYAVKVLGKYN